MDLQLRLIAVAATVSLFVLVLELVRRRRLLERYALLWLGCAGLLVLLSAWQGLLTMASSVIGIAYPPTALFVIAFLFVIVLLLHFSVAVSRLADQSKILAQRLARTEQRLQELADERTAGAPETLERLDDELPTVARTRTRA